MTYCCLISFFPIVDKCHSPTTLCDGAQMAIFGDFLHRVFSASRVQQVSDLHLKFTLRLHVHVWKLGLRASGNLPVSYVLTGNLPVSYPTLATLTSTHVRVALM